MPTEKKQIIIEADYSSAVKALLESKQLVSDLRAANKQLNDDYKSGTITQQQYSAQIEVNNAKIKNLSKEVNNNAKALQEEVLQVKGSEGAYQKLNLQYQLSAQKAKDLAASETATAKEIKKASDEANKLNDKLKDIDGTVGQSQRKVGSYSDAIKGLGAKFMSMVGITAIISGIGAALSNALSVITEFDQQMANVSAITNATKEEMIQLREIAIQYGTTTKFTSSEVAGLEVELGKLGYTTQQIIDATGGITLAAAATGEGLQRTAEIVGSVTMAFGLAAGESKRVADVMTQSFNSTALSLDNFSESIKYVAPVAKQVGVSVEETAALLGALANSGIKGSMAGTALRRIFSELTKDGGTLQEKLDKLSKSGLNLAGAQDEVGAHAKTALLVLKDQHDLIPKLTKEFENSAGASEKAASKMLDTIKGQSTLLKSTWESFILSIENGTGKFSTNLKSMLNGTNQFVQGLQRLLSSKQDLEKQDAKDSAQSRLKDFEKRAQTEKDYMKYLNEEIIAEKNVYVNKQKRIAQLESEIRIGKELGGAWDDNNGKRQEEIKGLQQAVNNSIYYVNALGNLRREKKDSAALELKNNEILAKNRAVTNDGDKKKTKEKYDYEQKLREANAKSIDDTMEREIELVKADIKTKQEELDKAYKDKLVTQKQYNELSKAYQEEQSREINTIENKYWLKSAKEFENYLSDQNTLLDKQVKEFWELIKSTDSKVLDLYNGQVQSAQNALEIESLQGYESAEKKKKLLESQRQMEIEKAKQTGSDVNFINKKYALLNNKVDEESLNAKLSMTSQTVNALKDAFGENTEAGKLAAVAGITIDAIEGGIAAVTGGIKAFGPVAGPIIGGIEAAALAVSAEKAITKVYAVENKNTDTKSTDTVTSKFHTGGIAGDNAMSPDSSNELTATLLKGERVLSLQQTGVFNSILGNLSNLGGSASITNNIGTQSNSSIAQLEEAFTRVIEKMPNPQISWTEFERQAQRQQQLKNNLVVR